VLLRKTLEDHYTTREQPVQGALEECLWEVDIDIALEVF
jgi:hypothetical protein